MGVINQLITGGPHIAGNHCYLFTIKYRVSGNFYHESNDSECSTRNFWRPFARRPSSSVVHGADSCCNTAQNISEISEVSGCLFWLSTFVPHSFHIVPPYSLTLMASQWHPNGIPMASQAFSMWISTIVHGSLVSLVFCSRFLASCRCLTSMLHRQKMISLPNDVNLPGWRKIHPRLSFSSFQHSPGLTPMTTSFALETPNLHPLTCPADRINHTRHTPITGSNVL